MALNREELFKKLQEDDNEAFKQVYREAYHYIENVLLKNGCNAEQAKDIFQEGILGLREWISKDDFSPRADIKR